MIVTAKTYTMPAGSRASIFDFALCYVTILQVKRQGTGYNHTASATPPANREYLHTVSDGSIDFEDYASTLPENQKVLVIYKY